MSSTPTRVLIVGCGNIAGGFDADRPSDALPLTHAGAYTRDGRFEIAACVEHDAARRRDFMARWMVPAGYASFDALPTDACFEVVSICSPTHLHASHLEAALRLRPRLIFCEKPVTPSLAETEDLVARCEAAGVLLAVNHTRRWAPDVIRLREALRAGEWGPLRSVVGHYNKGVLNNGGHMVDLLLYLLDEPLELVCAGGPVADFWDDDPTVAASLATPDGMPVYLNPAHAGDYALFELQLVTARGMIAMEDGGLAWRTRRVVDSPFAKGYSALASGDRQAGEYFAAMANAVANIHAALKSGAALASTGRTALSAQHICEAIKTAALAHGE